VSAVSTSRARDAARLAAKLSRSATTAASDSVESAETARYSWVLRTLTSAEPYANGPTWRVVSQMANPAATATATVAPRRPSRSPAQISAGNTT
jgi:hypothetical protein